MAIDRDLDSTLNTPSEVPTATYASMACTTVPAMTKPASEQASRHRLAATAAQRRARRARITPAIADKTPPRPIAASISPRVSASPPSRSVLNGPMRMLSACMTGSDIAVAMLSSSRARRRRM